MGRYFASRLFWGLLTIVGIAIVNFIILKATPGDPVLALIGDFPAPPEYIDKIRAEYGLDRPIYIQLLSYLKELATGNLGYSFANRQPVATLVWDKMVNTLIIILPALILSAILGVFLALFAAARGRAADLAVTGFTLFAYSIPVFWLGQVLIILVSVKAGWLPASGMFSLRAPSEGWGRIVDLAAHMLLPVLCIMTYKVAVFAWPGIGQLFVAAIGQRDYPVLQAILLMATVMVVVANILADLAYAWVDPRIRRNLGKKNA